MDALIGGLVTLVVTFLVQVFVIPSVQARTRNRERWENDVIELRTLIHEELPQAHRELGFAGGSVSIFEGYRGDSKYNADKLEELIRDQRKRLNVAHERCFEMQTRLSRLEGRASLVNRRDPYWRKLTLARHRYDTLLYSVYQITNSDSISESKLNDTLDELRAAHSDLANISREITDTLKPPPRRIIRMLYYRTRRALHRARKRT